MLPDRHVACRMDRAVIAESWAMTGCADMGPPVRDRAIRVKLACGFRGPMTCKMKAPGPTAVLCVQYLTQPQRAANVAVF